MSANGFSASADPRRRRQSPKANALLSTLPSTIETAEFEVVWAWLKTFIPRAEAPRVARGPTFLIGPTACASPKLSLRGNSDFRPGRCETLRDYRHTRLRSRCSPCRSRPAAATPLLKALFLPVGGMSVFPGRSLVDSNRLKSSRKMRSNLSELRSTSPGE